VGWGLFNDMLVRLSRARLFRSHPSEGARPVTEANLPWPADMRFASREKHIVAFEVGAGVVPGGGQMHGCRV